MIITKDESLIKWYSYNDSMMHSISIKDRDKKSTINLKELNESATNILKDNEDMCKKILHLGESLLGTSEAAVGFLLGWLIRSIKKDNIWDIEHTEEKIPDDELTEHFASLMEDYAKLIREKKGSGLPKVQTPTMGGPDVTELFK